MLKFSLENLKTAKSDELFEFTCKNCDNVFSKTRQYLIKNKRVAPKFCSTKCSGEYKSKTSNVNLKCANCKVDIKVKLSAYNKNGNNFCSSSCSATYNNERRDSQIYEDLSKTLSEKHWNGLSDEEKKREKGYSKICPTCNGNKDRRAKLCWTCKMERVENIMLNRTLGYYVSGKKYTSTLLSSIRQGAKKILLKSGRGKTCEYCKNSEFDDILEIHHIKGIMEFDESELIKVINSIDNLVWLCPNHHAMVERGLIKLKTNKEHVV